MPKKKELDIQKEVEKKHFRVAIFGSARIKKGHEVYNTVFELAEMIGENDFDIVTGGGPGLMEAANSGHKKGNTKRKAHSIGVTIYLPFETEPNIYLDIKKHFMRFSERLDQFMVLSSLAVITPGGIGTCLELFYTWQLTQVKHICSMPIILIGEQWKELIKWVRAWLLKNKLIDANDLKNIYVCNNKDEAMEIILKAHEVFEKEGDNYCFNYQKYKLN